MRIIESLSLEEYSKIIKFNYQPIATMPTDHVLQHHISLFLEHLQGQQLHYLLKQHVPIPCQLSS